MAISHNLVFKRRKTTQENQICYNANMIRIAIVEDNLDENNKLSSYLKKYALDNSLQFDIKQFLSAEPFLNSEDNFDIVFMDIELPKMDGMNASMQLRNKDKDIIIIFVTNMASFAIKGYEVDAMDFILKPIRYESLETKFKKAVDKIISKNEDILSLSINHSLKVFHLSDILYIEVLDHNLCVHTKDESYNTRGSLGKLEEELKEKNFFRCNNYCLVNLKAINEVEHDEIIIGDTRLKISRARKKEFTTVLCNYLGHA